MPAPLAHLRVVDLTDLRGAFAGRLLADLGADVIKVEPPRGDPGRLRGPFAGGVAAPDRGIAFLYRNANKRGAVIDLHAADGWRRFCELCERADVLVENLGPEAQHRHGLAPDEVRDRHPHLVHVAIADYGLSGPRAAWRLEALPAFAASGALHACGFPDRPPCWLPGYAAHDSASIFAVAGALAALLDRARHGRGQTVEVSVQEAGLNALNPWSIPLADYHRVYPMIPPVQTRNADGAYYVLATADGFVRVLPGLAAAVAGLRRARRQPGGARRAGVGAAALPADERRRHPAARGGVALDAIPRRGARRRAPPRRADHARQHAGRVRRRGADDDPGVLPADGVPARGRRPLRAGAVQLLAHPGGARAAGAGRPGRTRAASRPRLADAAPRRRRRAGARRRPRRRPRRRRGHSRDGDAPRRARRRGDQDRVARERRLPAAGHGRARCAGSFVDVQRRVARAPERRARPPRPAGARAGAPPLRRRRRRPREQPRWRRPGVGARLRGRASAAPRRRLRRLAGLRARWPARRVVGLRPAQLGLRRPHLALESSRRAVPGRLVAEPSGPHRSEARRGCGSRRARAPPPDGRGAVRRDVAGRVGRVPARRVLPRGAIHGDAAGAAWQRGRRGRSRTASTAAPAPSDGAPSP